MVNSLLVIDESSPRRAWKASNIVVAVVLTLGLDMNILSFWVHACDHLVNWEFTSSLCAAEYINTLPASSRWANK